MSGYWKKGFVLTEVVVALVIITILTTMVFVNLSGYRQKISLEKQMEMLLSDLRWAQQLAKTDSTLVIVGFYGGNQQLYYYQIKYYGRKNLGEIVKYVELPQYICMANIILPNVEFQADGTIKKNGRLIMQQGDQSITLYYYQTGRMRLTNGGSE